MTAILSAVTLANEAAGVINALMPLIQQHLDGGKEVTADDVRAALAGKDSALKRLDDEIARQGG